MPFYGRKRIELGRLSLWNAALRGGGGAAVSAEAQQFFGRVSDPGASRRTLYAALIDALVAGGVWSKLDALYVLAAADAPTALENLVQDAFNAAVVSTPTFTADRGYIGAPAKYINTTYNPTTAAGHMTQNSVSLFAWSLTAGQKAGAILGGASSANIGLFPRYTDDKFYADINSGAGDTGITVATGAGLKGGVRRLATAYDYYLDGANSGTRLDNSVPLVNQDIHLLELGAGSEYTGQVAAASLGGALSDADVLVLYNALHTYLVAVGAVALAAFVFLDASDFLFMDGSAFTFLGA